MPYSCLLSNIEKVNNNDIFSCLKSRKVIVTTAKVFLTKVFINIVQTFSHPKSLIYLCINYLTFGLTIDILRCSCELKIKFYCRGLVFFCLWLYITRNIAVFTVCFQFKMTDTLHFLFLTNFISIAIFCYSETQY